MKMEIQKPMMGKPATSSWQRRLAWLLGIWLVSVLVLAGMAYGMRLLMSAAGMTASGQSAYSATQGGGGRQVARLLAQPHGAIAAVAAQAATSAGRPMVPLERPGRGMAQV
ncbi:DUF2474 domain-containing protein [Kerstersia gyiorum]|uniref:DUF2474 domain-containing protein n=1 Tax=Kerstersia gyiorum TaxID=206506 RepID=UPI0039E94C9F